MPAGDLDRAVVNCVESALTRRAEQAGEGLEEPIELGGSSVPEQRKVLLENEVRVQLESSGIIVRFGDDFDERI